MDTKSKTKEGSFKPYGITPTQGKVRGQTSASKTVEGSFSPYGIVKKFIAPDPTNIVRGDILPIKKNTDTGEVSLATPGVALEGLRALTGASEIYSRVLNGEISPDDPRAIAAAGSLSMGMMGGGMASPATNAGRGTVGMFMGPNSLTFDRTAATESYKMKLAGAKAREIWEKTQTRRWKSGARQEISDDTASIKPDWFDLPFETTKLGNFLDHPDLYKAYPSLKNTKVIITDDLKPGAASYDLDANIITISKQDALAKNISPMLHEVQHSIQYKEGFDSGTSPSFILKEIKAGRVKPLKNLTDEESSSYYYAANAGEVEARNTQARKAFNKNQRKQNFPDDTQGTYTFDYIKKMYDRMYPEGYK